MLKNTVIDLWDELGKARFSETEDGERRLEENDGFLGFRRGTSANEILQWFDRAFAEWGGLNALPMIPMDRKFTVETPVGIIEVYAKTDEDDPDSYPGVYIDIRRTENQLNGSVIGDLACCVEYDSSAQRMQVVTYQPAEEEPAHIEVYEPTMTMAGLKSVCKDGSYRLYRLLDAEYREIPDVLNIDGDTPVIWYKHRICGIEAMLDFSLSKYMK